MIVVRIFGGLGNQMFQYAAGRALAAHHGVPLKVDLRWLNRYHTGFQLADLPIKAEVISLKEAFRFTWFPFHRHPFFFYIKIIKEFNNFIFLENSFNYDHSFFELGEEKYLFGYFQSEKYFNNFRSIIFNEFKYTPDYKIYKSDVVNTINQTNTTAIQFRRGDYITDKKANETFGICPMDYYERAIEYIRTRQSTKFLIFSDDINWCRKNVILEDAFYVERQGGSVIDDMFLAAQCKNIIMANSTFSWWSAWLNSNAGKIVIAPNRWFKDQNLNDQSEDLIPEEWILL